GPSRGGPVRWASSSSPGSAMKTRLSCATGLSGAASRTSISRSSLGLEPESSSAATSWTSNSRALTIRKQTFSDEIDRSGINPSLLGGDGRLQLCQPDIGAAVRGRTPIAARRQRTARRYLGSIGQRRALELVAEEAPQ